MSCITCGNVGPHTPERCHEDRPKCHVEGCENKTCIQAIYNGYVPTCLECFFEARVAVKRPDVSLAERLSQPIL